MNDAEIQQVVEQAVRVIRKSTPEQIAELFAKHLLKPMRGDIFNRRFGDLPSECCGGGVILYDLIHSGDRHVWYSDMLKAGNLLMNYYSFCAFGHGFDGIKLPKSGWPDEYKDLYAKGRRVWELVTQQKEKA